MSASLTSGVPSYHGDLGKRSLHQHKQAHLPTYPVFAMHKLCSQTELKFPSYFPSSKVLTHFLPTHTEHRQTAAGHICSIKATPGSDAPVRTCAASAIPGHFLKLNLAGQSCKPLCSYCKGQSELLSSWGSQD